MAYVAPNWKNGTAPALDAAALQAISDAIVANQTKNTQQDSSISSLQTAVNGKSRVATGSYTGTGTYGSSNPNSITFPFTPKLVIVSGSISSGQSKTITQGSLLWISGVTISTLAGNWTGTYDKYISVSGTRFSWFETRTAINQLNESNQTYYYIGIS